MTVVTTSTTIVVFEAKPFWAPELRRQLMGLDVTIRECRSLQDVLPAVSGSINTLLILDIEPYPEACLKWMIETHAAKALHWPVIACGSESTADLEWRFRDVGVTAFLVQVIPGDSFASLCRRQLGLDRRSKPRADA